MTQMNEPIEIYTSNRKDDLVINDILEGLVEYNDSQVPRNKDHYIVALKCEGSTLGGAQCTYLWDWMYVKLLWVTKSQRNKGYGMQLMKIIEKEARSRDCVGIHLDTFSFQAKGFYQKLGYEEFGMIPDHPRGYNRHFLMKLLSG